MPNLTLFDTTCHVFPDIGVLFGSLGFLQAIMDLTTDIVDRCKGVGDATPSPNRPHRTSSRGSLDRGTDRPVVQGYLLGRPMRAKQAYLALRQASDNRPGPLSQSIREWRFGSKLLGAARYSPKDWVILRRADVNSRSAQKCPMNQFTIALR